MKEVLTITLNPTVDKSSSVASIKPEKKLRCAKPLYEPGGGGINVSRGLVRLGVKSSALFFSGGNSGKLLEQLLITENVAVIPVCTSGNTRENFIVVDTSSNEQYRFGFPGEEIQDSEAELLLKQIEGINPFPEYVVISGSIPPGITLPFLHQLIKTIKCKGAKIIADTSGDALQKILEEGVFLLKPNIGELSRLLSKEEIDNDAAATAAKTLIDEGKAEIVVISMGPQGAYIITKDLNTHIPAPSVKKLSTVGAGDSMVAGMVSVLATGGTPLNAARMGVACGTAATMNPGTGLFKKEDAERLYQWLLKHK